MTNARFARSIGLILTGMLFLCGCSKDSPVAPMTEQGGPAAKMTVSLTSTGAATTSGMMNPTLTTSGSTTSDCSTTSAMTCVVWPSPNQPATDILRDSVYVTPNSSGTVKAKWSNWDPIHNKLSTVSFSLKIPAGAVSAPKMISITVDKNAPEITAEFGPSGLVFLTPALLTVTASGLDLSAFKYGDHVDLWYVNNTGWVQTMQYSKFLFDPIKGTMAATNIQIPHFSRYCFGR